MSNACGLDLSRDGSKFVMGALWDNTVRVFYEDEDEVWTVKGDAIRDSRLWQKIFINGYVNIFGHSVAVSDDGDM